MHILASFALRYRTDFGKTQPPNRGSMEAASLLLDGFAKGVQLDTLLFARDSMDGGDPPVWRRDDAVSTRGSSPAMRAVPDAVEAAVLALLAFGRPERTAPTDGGGDRANGPRRACDGPGRGRVDLHGAQ